jgi:CheY-like chemotaxis protein
VDEVIKAGKRAAELTHQLLAFSRREVLRARPVKLNEVVQSAARLLERLIGENISLGLKLSPTLGEIQVDPGHLEQVIVNLAVNARDAMPKGGKLTLETAEVVLDERYVRGHIGAKPGRYGMLAVTDTGHGMDEATQARIFEPFFTTKETGQGTGLGLATVFGIVKQSGGDVCVYSAPGRGTTFKVYLPRTEAPGAEADETPPAADARGNESILLVEDDAAVRAVARRALSEAGFRVLEAAHPEEALRLAGAEPFDLLLTDVVMPQRTGPELAQALLATRPGLKVIYMSGYTGGALAHQGVVDAGAHYLPKPFTPAALVAQVRSTLDG